MSNSDAPKLKQYFQANRVSCGACAYGTLLSGLNIYLTEAQACDEVKTTINGTDTYYVFSALHKRNIECNFIQIDKSFKEYGRWLYLNSLNRLLYVGIVGKVKGKYGEKQNHDHAVCIANGWVFDSIDNCPYPLEEWASRYNDIIIDDMIVVDNPRYTRGLLDI